MTPMLHRFPFAVENDWSAGFRAGLGIALLVDLGLVFFALALSQ